MEEKLHSWERQLWELVINGDGLTCPLYDFCFYRKQGVWCFGEHLSEISQLLDGELNLIDCDSCAFVGTGKQRPGTPYGLTEKLAGKWVTEYGIQSPLVPDELIELSDKRRSVEVRRLPLHAYHGAIWLSNNEWIIHLNSNDEPGMIRHTLFHEAFHIMAHCKGSPVFKRNKLERDNFNETLADYFAMCFLMPRKWINEKWTECNDISKMAELFGVPLPSMNLRLRWLHLI